MDENSCNAVDIPLTEADSLVMSTDSNFNRINKYSNIIDLSFNGKIQRKTCETSKENDWLNDRKKKTNIKQSSLGSSNVIISATKTWQPQFSDRRKSPDLFEEWDNGDSNDKEENENKHNDCSNNDVSEKENTKENVIENLPDMQKISWDNVKSYVLRDPLERKDEAETKYTNATKAMEANNRTTEKRNEFCASIISSLNNNKYYYEKYQENCRAEKLMQKRITECLSGVLPPPSVTTPALDMFTAVLSHKDAILNFLNETVLPRSDANNENNNKNEYLRAPSLLKPTCTLEEARSTQWPHILALKHHGLSYNLCEDSELNDYLSLTVIDRFIGAETTSSYVNSNSAAKSKISRFKNICQSPGNRLSHLARRKTVFSSANLESNILRTNNLIGPQIILDQRKGKSNMYNGRNTPKRKTPSSSKKMRRKTPKTSARKRLFHNEMSTITRMTVAGHTVETVKRAIFQSPPKDKIEKCTVLDTSNSVPLFPPSVLIKPEINERVKKSKRALWFSPENAAEIKGKSYLLNSISNSKLSCQLSSNTLKRKRRDICEKILETEDDELSILHNNKLFKSYKETGLTARTLNIKSQSFCINSNSTSTTQLPQLAQTPQLSQQQCIEFSTQPAASTSTNFLKSLEWDSTSVNNTTTLTTSNKPFQRAFSETIMNKNVLTENQKKKLLWAVSQALQDKKITVKHEKFKQYAAMLARVVKRIFQEYYQNNCISHSETMLRLAKRYVYQVIQGFKLDDIYAQAKQQIDDVRRPNNKRLTGYIAREEYENFKQQELQRKQQQNQQSNIISKHFKLKENQQHQVVIQDNISQMQSELYTKATTITSPTSQYIANLKNQSGLGETIGKSYIATKLNSTATSITITTSNINNNNLTNSSSKSNLNGSVLRENASDCCLTRSAQKLFTGKDQSNKSPYATVSGGSRTSSAIKVKTQLINNSNHKLSDKARRQIIFDI